MSNPKHIAVVLVIAGAIIAAGCLGQGLPPATETISSSSNGLAYGGAVPASISAPAQKLAVGQVAGAAGTAPTVETKIIKTGQVTIEVPQVPLAIDRVRDIAVSTGGYLSSSNVYTSQNNRKTGYVTIRIPADKFDTVMQALAPLGKVLSSSEERSDVTEQYVDLTIQNASYHTQLANYYRLMDKATSVEDIIKIQAQIDQITLSLNQVEGRLRYLSSQIDLSTITVNLQEPVPVGGQTGYNIVTAINEGIAGFFGMISAIIAFVFTVMPLVIIGIVVYAVYRWHRKRKGGASLQPAAKKEGEGSHST
jgi:hypothetical protein